MQISHRVLNVLFLNHNYLFGNVVIKRLVLAVMFLPLYGMDIAEHPEANPFPVVALLRKNFVIVLQSLEPRQDCQAQGNPQKF